MEKRVIPFSPPDISSEDIDGVIEALRSGWITTGPKTKEFEKKIAQYCKTEKAVCLNSQTAAAEMTLHLLGVGADDEVIVPAYTYSATASVIEHVGAKIVMIDSQSNSVEMDYDELEKAITEKTKVIIPVDIAGIMCDYNRIFSIVEKKKHLFKPRNDIQKAFSRIIVMDDAAHAFGASREGKICGSVADFTNFSFHAVKNLTTAEGGAVVWKNIPGFDNDDIYHQYMLLSLHGQSKDALAKTKLGAWEYDIVGTYYKCNMTDIVAGLGLSQLQRYDSMLKRRHKIIRMYDQAFADEPVDVLNHEDKNHHSSGHLYFIRLKGKHLEERNSFIEKMADKGVSCNVHYKPMPMFTAYKKLGFTIENYLNAYQLFENEVTLPLHTSLSDEDVQYIIENVKLVLKEI